MSKIPVIALVGPTAVGKTKLSIEIAKKFNCEIISMDSVQIYKEFNIASAKISKEEMDGVVHHLIDILSPSDNFSVYDFQKLARAKIEEVYNKNKIPLLVGGSGFYINAVLNDYKFSKLENEEKNLTTSEMLYFLRSNYYETYLSIDKNNSRRIINAYNYVINEKKSLTDNNLGDNVFYKYNPHIICLTMPRKLLYERINKRVIDMVSLGLIEEVKNIIKKYGVNLQPLLAIGYKEVISFLNNEIDKDKMLNDIQQNSRRYAKRQLTWFKNKTKCIWYDTTQTTNEKILLDIFKFLKGDNVENN